MNGLDVTHYDGLIEWTQTQEKFGFVYIQLTNGLTVTPLSHQNWDASGSSMMDRGPYHYFLPARPSWCVYSTTPEQYISNCVQGFIRQFGDDYGGQYPPALDIETNGVELGVTLTGAQVLQRAKWWLDEMEDELIARGFNIKPAIYCSPGFWQSIGGQSATWARDYPLWLAWYKYDLADNFYSYWYPKILSGDFIAPIPPKPWDEAWIWQWTKRGRPSDIPGYPSGKKEVDLDVLI